MRRFCIALAGALFLAGCMSAPTPLTENMFEDDGLPERPDQFLGNIRHAFSDHVDDCVVGLSFTSRSISRGIAADWERFSRTLD
ncbi:MAG: hypothetical protein MUE73_00420 [Planctomycetes bacterium]|jgi:hypothetical protein|nr:hypothetical protein [Planctomycetota bacterium]